MTAVIGGVFYLVRSWPLVLVSAIVGGLYLGGLFLVRAIDVDEVRMLARSLRSSWVKRRRSADTQRLVETEKRRKDSEPA